VYAVRSATTDLGGNRTAVHESGATSYPGTVAENVAALPHPALRPYVHRYIGYRHETAPGRHRGLPSRFLTVVLTLDGTVDFAPGHGHPRSLAMLAGGLHTTPVLMEHDGHQHGIQIAFTPLGSRALLGRPAGELTTVVDLPAVLGSAAGELVERIRAAGTWAERFAHLDAVLRRIAVPAAIPSPEVAWAWRRMTRSPGAVAVGTLAAEVGWSRQHLRTRFLREFGVTPKEAARVMRFEVSRQLLVTARRPPLADVAARCGYADQSHLSREWRDLAGASPSVWMAEELPFVQDSAPAGAASWTA
jgi:AraC-like DNA-binding protein